MAHGKTHGLRLVVMRHAKSDWDSDAKSDHERPLNHRGQREAPAVGALLRKKGYRPDLVFSSDSVRTRETWERMSDELEGARVVFDASLYLAGVEAVRRAASTHESDFSGARTVMVLGHNPGWEEMVRSLSGHRVDLKTAHAAVLESRSRDAGWTECLADEGGFDLVELVRPD